MDGLPRGLALLLYTHAGCPNVNVRFDTMFTLEFPRPTYIAGEASEETSVKVSVETPVKTPDLILQQLRDHPEWTLSEVAIAIDKSVSAVERASSKLVKQGKLKHVGPQKGGHWEVMDEE